MLTVAVVGATGAVGREVVGLLEELGIPIGRLRLIATSRSAGTKINFRREDITVEDIEKVSFESIDFAIFDTPDEAAVKWVPVAQTAGCIVIDNSAAYRMHERVPLVIPEINADEIEKHSGVIANPNCTTCIGLMALAPLNKAFGLTAVVGATYQAVSGAGDIGIRQLHHELRSYEGPVTEESPGAFAYPIVGNVIPKIGSVKFNGYTSEELKFGDEGRKILGLPEFTADITCVRTDVLRSHSLALTAFFHKNEPSLKLAREAISSAPGLRLRDDPENEIYPMPRTVTEQMHCEVGRLRRLSSFSNALNLFVSGDQLWKGAALNAVQILQHLLR